MMKPLMLICEDMIFIDSEWMIAGRLADWIPDKHFGKNVPRLSVI